MKCPVDFCESELVGCDDRCWQHCKTGISLYNDMRKLHECRLSDVQLNVGYMKIMDKLQDHAVECHGLVDNRPKKSHTGNGAYQGKFAFTLTKSTSDELSEEDMIKAVRKIMNQKSCPVKEYAWYLEYADSELGKHPHIHGMYETESGGRIEAKHFKRAWKIWDEKYKLGKGFRGGYHRPVRDGEAYSDYIRKDGGLNESYFLPNSIDGR